MSRDFPEDAIFVCSRCRGGWPAHRVHPAIHERGTCAQCEMNRQPGAIRLGYLASLATLVVLTTPKPKKAAA